MIVIYSTPRTMSAWLSNLLTVPNQSLFVHDAGLSPDVMGWLDRCEIPYTGTVMTVGGLPLPWEPSKPALSIIRDKDVVVDRTQQLFGSEIAAQAYNAYDRIISCSGPVYHIESMDDWIADVYERCTGLPFDPVRYAALKNLWIESRFTAKWRQGVVDMSGLDPLKSVW